MAAARLVQSIQRFSRRIRRRLFLSKPPITPKIKLRLRVSTTAKPTDNNPRMKIINNITAFLEKSPLND